jgi:hypothetical protein
MWWRNPDHRVIIPTNRNQEGENKFAKNLFALDPEVRSTSGDRKKNFLEWVPKVRNYNTKTNKKYFIYN